jgi:hypothetical protein
MAIFVFRVTSSISAFLMSAYHHNPVFVLTRMFSR